MTGKIIHAIVFLVVMGIAVSAVMNSDPEDPAKLASQLPALLLAGLYFGFIFVVYVLPKITGRATTAVFASGETTARDPMYKAQAAVARGDYIEAIGLYRAIALDEPENRLPWVEIAKIQLDKLEDPEIAINTLQTALEDNEWPADDAAFFMSRIAEIRLDELDDKETCIAILDQIVETFPNSQYSASATHRLNEIERAQEPAPTEG